MLYFACISGTVQVAIDMTINENDYDLENKWCLFCSSITDLCTRYQSSTCCVCVCVSGAVQVPVRDSARVHVVFVFVFQEQYKFLYEIALEYMLCLCLCFRSSTSSCTR